MQYSSIQKKVRKKKLLRLFRKYRPYLMLALAVAVIVLIVCGVVNAVKALCAESNEPQETSQVIETTPFRAAEETPEVQAQVMTDDVYVADTLSFTRTVFEPNEDDVVMLAKLIWGEARGVQSTDQKAAVVWCVLNRVDDYRFPDTIAGVVTQKSQFVGYDVSYPATDEFKEIARDVLIRWYLEKDGDADVGRTLPNSYLYFTGDGVRNNFTVDWKSRDYFDWSLPSPYGE